MQASQRRLVCPSLYQLCEVMVEFIFIRKSVFNTSYMGPSMNKLRLRWKNCRATVWRSPRNNYELKFASLKASVFCIYTIYCLYYSSFCSQSCLHYGFSSAHLGPAVRQMESRWALALVRGLSQVFQTYLRNTYRYDKIPKDISKGVCRRLGGFGVWLFSLNMIAKPWGDIQRKISEANLLMKVVMYFWKGWHIHQRMLVEFI